MLTNGIKTTLHTDVVSDADLRHAQKPGYQPAFIEGNEWSVAQRVESP